MGIMRGWSYLLIPVVFSLNIPNNLFNSKFLSKPNIKTEEQTTKPAKTTSTEAGLSEDLSIYFYGKVTDETCLQLTQTLKMMDIAAKHQKVMYPQLEPVVDLHIQSGGGSLMPTLYVCDVIKNSDTPIHTYVDGYCASATSLISVCGKKRYMTKHSALLIHQLSAMAAGKFNELKTEVNNLNSFMNSIRDIYLKNTKIDKDSLESLLKTDVWLDSDICLQYGLIDEII